MEPQHDRKEEEYPTHDEVIASLEASLVGDGFRVKTNPSKLKNNSVKRDEEIYYPDLYIYEDGTVKRVYEVETECSVNDEAAEQWKYYASGRVDFYLVVPETKEDEAKALCQKHSIAVVKVLTYKL